jgi:hypothetical protein
LGIAVGQEEAGVLDAATTGWLLVSTALVFLMVIGLAFYYGGLVRRKTALNTMMMSFVALGIVGLTWTVIGYSLAYAEGAGDVGGGGEGLVGGGGGGVGGGGGGRPRRVGLRTVRGRHRGHHRQDHRHAPARRPPFRGPHLR